MPQLITLAILCIAFALLAIWLSNWLQQRSGVPQGKVVYDDAGSWYEIPKPLFDKSLMLTGKPDYVIRAENGSLIPVEYKSAKAPKRPYESHIMQLAAYCALIESHFGERPAYGIIRYADRSFNIDYTDELENDLLDILEDMRIDLEADDVPRSHDEWHRCNGCGFKIACEDSLVE
ncbi:MAG: CRISPR-associated exonuclease Cas4 [Cellvibrionaceae bacterium]|jgi:CRISPR-associated exonuclease Cas4